MNTHRLHTASKRRREVRINKILVMLTVCLFVMGLSIFFGNSLVDAHDNSEDTPVQYKYYRSIEIESGDTLWSIAEEYADEHYDSIYDYIYEIKDMNGLISDDIQSGQYLTIAYYDKDIL